MPSGIISLLTDFGTKDPFVGVMKAVILSRHRAATIVDLAHGIAPQSVIEAAFWLERCFRYFPAGSVHLAVVDPGVGSERAAVAVEAHGHWFVGPDNGLFACVAVSGEVRRIDRDALGLPLPSATFHGRDVFAPAAAELARGFPFSSIGPLTALEHGPRVPEAERVGSEVRGVVVSVDRFGNAITNIGRELLPAQARVLAGATELGVVRTYSDVEPGERAALIGSFETLEIAERDGDAARALRLERGSVVVVRAQDPAAAERR